MREELLSLLEQYCKEQVTKIPTEMQYPGIEKDVTSFYGFYLWLKTSVL